MLTRLVLIAVAVVVALTRRKAVVVVVLVPLPGSISCTNCGVRFRVGDRSALVVNLNAAPQVVRVYHQLGLDGPSGRTWNGTSARTQQQRGFSDVARVVPTRSRRIGMVSTSGGMRSLLNSSVASWVATAASDTGPDGSCRTLALTGGVLFYV